MKILFTLFIAFMTANYGHCLNLPYSEKEDYSHFHDNLIADLQELLENVNVTEDPTTAAPIEELPKEISASLKQDLLDILQNNKDLFDKPEQEDDFSSYIVKKKRPIVKPGQTLSKCYYYKYGCCQDRYHPADGPRGKGCGLKICTDESPGLCARENRKGKLDCRGQHRSVCAYTCRNCRSPAPAKMVQCISRLNPWGCCWNGEPALGPNQRGCRPCFDTYRHVCNQFKSVSSGCKSGSYGIRTFMNKHCPRTCNNCRTRFYTKK